MPSSLPFLSLSPGSSNRSMASPSSARPTPGITQSLNITSSTGLSKSSGNIGTPSGSSSSTASSSTSPQTNSLRKSPSTPNIVRPQSPTPQGEPTATPTSPRPTVAKIGRAVQQECRDRSRMPSSA
eukprot:TRINITY_DN22031_c0_g1_i1.p1 TRINITY_DN22031_c0_g1~~TRINITY_DN22031_c0_g1_i1.p1  ORF type:complete len:126 (+),score=1.20 TRINITY_DN22031_c0_g1_i1:2-379(+)